MTKGNPTAGKVAYVLGGGGQLGAHEVGMLRALLERELVPELVLGTSVGAINGAAVATEPTPATVERLTGVWSELEQRDTFASSLFGRLATLARTGTHLHGNEPLRGLLERWLPVERIEDLPVAFQCVAARIETASEHWFTAGSLIDAVMASSAVPGILPPYAIDGQHYIDGGIVNSIPVRRAVELGAATVFVLHVGRLDRPLEPPRRPWEVALVAFEIARRHRFVGDLATLPEDVAVHVMPTGQVDPPSYTDLSQFRYRDTSKIGDRIARAYDASARYLAERSLGR